MSALWEHSSLMSRLLAVAAGGSVLGPLLAMALLAWGFEARRGVIVSLLSGLLALPGHGWGFTAAALLHLLGAPAIASTLASRPPATT
jgi:hypothetical protein